MANVAQKALSLMLAQFNIYSNGSKESIDNLIKSGSLRVLSLDIKSDEPMLARKEIYFLANYAMMIPTLVRVENRLYFLMKATLININTIKIDIITSLSNSRLDFCIDYIELPVTHFLSNSNLFALYSNGVMTKVSYTEKEVIDSIKKKGVDETTFFVDEFMLTEDKEF